MAARECRARRLGAPRRYNNAPSSVIAFGDATFPPGWGRLVGCVLQASPTGGKLASEARLMRGRTVEGRGMFRPRARYFPWMESTQRSPGLRTRTRTQSARLEKGLNLFGAGVNLGPLHLPLAAARIYQIHVSPLFPLAPLVCLAFPALFGRGRPMWRPGSVGRDDSARRVVTITPPHPSSPSAMPPSPLGGEGLLGAFYRLPPQGGSWRAKRD